MQFSSVNLVITQMKESLRIWQERNPEKQAPEKHLMIQRLEEFVSWTNELHQKAEATDRAFFKCGKIAQTQYGEIAQLKQRIESMDEYLTQTQEQ